MKNVHLQSFHFLSLLERLDPRQDILNWAASK